ncbi:MAG: type II toxin-antitoxin system RatA family toxin [Candidatus Competibacterales bacterium]
MSSVHKKAIVPYTPAQMYKLVNDVEAYPQFLPWCSGARVISRTTQEVWATVDINKGGVKKSFTTRNRLEPHRRINLRLVDGPFDRLEGAWHFIPQQGDGCQVELAMEFEFSSSMLRLVVGPVFQHIASTMVDAFCRRAAALYGP